MADKWETLRISLPPDEYEALSKLAEADLRSISHEARYLIRRAVIRAGLLTAEPLPSESDDA